MDRALAAEAARLLASARAALAELAEEGLEALPAPAAAPEAGAPPEPPARPEADGPGAPSRGAGAREPAPAPAATGPAGGAAQGALLGEETGFGERPTLARVREVLGECTRCGLCEGRTQIVFGDGSEGAELLFVGEGPGEQEDLQGLPFVGRAGELLTRMIERGLGLARSEVYICNIVKCRPPGNRVPSAGEVAACRPFLDGQIDAVRPKVIVTLGKPASSLLLGRDIAITKVRGRWHDYRGIPVMPTFHPAFVLRQYTEANRRMVWQDLKAALSRARDDATPT